MQIDELISLTQWIREHVQRAGIEKKYALLVEKLRTNTQPGQPRVSFQAEKEDLFSALIRVPLYQLSQAQTEVLSTVGVMSNVGEAGVQQIEAALVNSGLDIANALERIESMSQLLANGVQWANDMHPRLSPLGTSGSVIESGDEVLVRVRFAGDAAIENVVHLKKWTAAWWEIGRGITMLNREKPEDMRVVGASNGSVIVWLVTSIAVSKTLTSILSDILKITERVLGIQRTIEEVRALRIANDAAEVALKQEIQEVKQTAVQSIVSAAITHSSTKSKTDGELANVLTKAVERLLEFSENGGEVDFVLPESDEEASQELLQRQLEIRQSVEEVRKLEASVKQLELFRRK